MTEAQQQKLSEVTNAVQRAIRGFLFEPNEGQMRQAIQNALATAAEVELRRLIADGLFVEVGDGNVLKVSVSQPLGDVLAQLYGVDVFENLFEDYAAVLPGWSKPENPEQTPTIDVNPSYIDPRTQRPTHGRLGHQH